MRDNPKHLDRHLERFQKVLGADDGFRSFYKMLDRGLEMAGNELSGSIVARNDDGADFMRGALISGELLASIVGVRNALVNVLSSDILEAFDSAVIYWRDANRDKILTVTGARMPATESFEYIVQNSPQAFIRVLDKALAHAESKQYNARYFESRPKLIEQWAELFLKGKSLVNLREILTRLEKLSESGVADNAYTELMYEFRFVINIWMRPCQDRITALARLAK